MHKLIVLAMAAAMAMGSMGCMKAVPKMWQASGGSKADATVEVGFTYYPQHEKPEPNEAQARNEAIKRCQAWGYADAEPFGMYKEQCQKWDFIPFAGMQCSIMLVTRQFQCLGQNNQNN